MTNASGVAEAHLFFARTRLTVSWRAQMGRRKAKSGGGGPQRSIYVPYIDVDEVKRVLRLAIIQGVIDDWTADFEVLERREERISTPEGGEALETHYTVRCVLSLKVGGETLRRQDVGEGRDLKAAFSDALKRAAQHYGIGAVLEGLGAVSVEVDAYGNLLPKEEERLRRLVEEAYERLYAELGVPIPLPAKEEKREADSSPTTPQKQKGAPNLDLPPVGKARQEVKAGEPGGIPEELKPLLADMVKADDAIGQLVDRFPEKVKAVRILGRYGWKRGVFKEGFEDVKALRTHLASLLKREVPSSVEGLKASLEEVKSEARKLYAELRQALAEVIPTA